MAHPPLRLPLYGEPVVATSGGEGTSAAEREASTASANTASANTASANTASANTAHSSSPALPAPASGPALVDEADRNEALMQVGDLARETGKTVRALHLYE